VRFATLGYYYGVTSFFRMNQTDVQGLSQPIEKSGVKTRFAAAGLKTFHFAFSSDIPSTLPFEICRGSPVWWLSVLVIMRREKRSSTSAKLSGVGAAAMSDVRI
jgi:hypothetical protein